METLKQKIAAQEKVVAANWKKFKRARKAHEQSQKTGSEKQQKNCRMRMRTAKRVHWSSFVVLQRLKDERKKARAEARKNLAEKLHLKQAATWTCVGLFVVGAAVGYTIFKGGSESGGASSPASDTF